MEIIIVPDSLSNKLKRVELEQNYAVKDDFVSKCAPLCDHVKSCPKTVICSNGYASCDNCAKYKLLLPSGYFYFGSTIQNIKNRIQSHFSQCFNSKCEKIQ